MHACRIQVVILWVGISTAVPASHASKMVSNSKEAGVTRHRCFVHEQVVIALAFVTSMPSLSNLR